MYCFTEFMQSWGIIHKTSSPGHQTANGKAEAAVKSVMNMLKRTSHDNSDQYSALLEMRNTPAKMSIAAMPKFVWAFCTFCVASVFEALYRLVWRSGLPFRTIPREHWLI